MKTVPANLLQRSCPVCEHNTAEAFGSKGELFLVRCRKCSMIYANPVAPELEGSFYEGLAQPFYLSPEKLASDYASVRFQRELRLFGSFCRAGRVLDVGCSTGAFLYQLKTRWPGDYEVLGTDVVREALAYASQQGVTVLKESFLDYEPGQDKFDAVTFWAVMEHLMTPATFLAKAARVLKPGGFCFILVPNFESLAVRFLGLRYRYIMAEHLNYFTAASLRQLASREPALQVVKLASTHWNPVVLWQDWRKPRKRVPDAERVRLLTRTTGWKHNRWLLPLQLCYRGLERGLGGMNLADNLCLVLQKGPTPA